MFAITCPKCQHTTTTKAIRDGREMSCPDCEQRLRVVVKDAGAGGASAVVKGGGPSLLVIGGCGLAGLGLSAVLVLVWFFCGREPAATPADSPRVAQSTEGSQAQLVPLKETRKPDKGRDKASPRNTDKPTSDSGKPAKDGDKPAKDGGKPARDGGKPAKDTSQPAKDGSKPGEDPAVVVKSESLPNARLLSSEEICRRLYRSTVLIYVVVRTRTGKLAWARGTGALLDLNERLVITNEHVANRGSKLVVVLFPAFDDQKKLITDPKFYEAERDKYLKSKKEGGIAIGADIARADAVRDLTLLKLKSLPPDVAALRLAPAGANPGQHLNTVGGLPKGTGGVWSYSDGKARQITRQSWPAEGGFFHEAEVIESTVVTNPGNSGGPIVDDRCRLVAVHSWGVSGAVGVVGHIHLPEVRTVLRDYYSSIGKVWNPPAEEEGGLGQEDLQKLIKALGSPDKATRRGAIQTLGQLGRGGRNAVPTLLKLARDPKEAAEVRNDAQAALPQIGAPKKEELTALGAALHDKHYPAVRTYAAEALGGVGEAAAAQVPDLVGACKDPDAAVRSSAALALGKIGSSARAGALPELRRLLDDKQDVVRRAAMQSLLNLGKPVPADAPALKAMLANRASFPEQRLYAILALATLGPDSAPALAEALAVEQDTDVLQILCRALGILKPRTRQTGRGLLRLIGHETAAVRLAAAGTLGQIGFDPTTLPAILKGLSSEDAQVRRLLFDRLPALTSYARKPVAVTVTGEDLEALKAALGSPYREARFPAAYLVSRLGAAAAPAVPDLRKALAEEKQFETPLEILTTLEILNTLTDLAPHARDSFAEVEALMSDTKAGTAPRQRAAALCLLRLMAGDKDLSKKHALKAYKILARGLEVADDSSPRPFEASIYERSRKAVETGGLPAATALYQVATSYFQDDPTRPRAREVTCELFGKMDIQTMKVYVVRMLRRWAARPGDVPAVRQAAAAALQAIRTGTR